MKLTLGVSGFIISLTLQSSALYAASLTFKITNQQQQPLPDTVVELRSLTDPVVKPQRIQVAQQQLTFVPFVSAIPAGSQVEFPNLDKTRHHVYSFSPAKQFEIKLYADKPETPIIFDTPGIIALGCNIHDYMQAYIYVSESNLVAVSDETGKLTWPDIAPGSYQLYLWHPWQLESRQPTVLEVVMPVQTAVYTLDVDLSQQKPQPPQRGFGSR